MGVASTDPPLDQCPEPIAIVGMGCRWPGGIRNTSQLWDLLKEKRDGFAEFEKDRINIDGFYHPNGQRPGSMYTKGGFLISENTHDFDHTFFGMTAVEAMALDPSQRKLLEVTYEAVESAGVSLEKLSGTRTGVFVGNFNNEHQTMQLRDTDHTLPYVVTGGGPTILSNRINYVFNINGPSLMVDTACSASMYALHLAVLAIRNGDCEGALVAGANVILGPDNQILTTKLGAVSPTSRCHTFDASADGYARAEGFGAFYLKKFSDALKDGNPIRAVIRGTSFNANGRTGGISHPSSDGQEAVMRQAYKNAGGLNPDLTGYTECHGTGTQVGDPTEVSAVGRVFSAGRTREPLLIGSIKPNLGHSEAASAMSQLMKAVLAMEHGEIPATIHITKFNPSIDFETARCKVVTEMTPWPANLLRRVSVNSFGYGGANAHCILDHPSVLIPGFQQPGFPLAYRNSDPSALNATRNGVNRHTNGDSNGVNEVSTNGHTSGHTNGHKNGHTNGNSNGYTNGHSHHANLTSTAWCNLSTPANSDKAGVRERIIVPISAHDDKALKSVLAEVSSAIGKYQNADLLYTLGARRSRFSRRAFAVVEASKLSDGIDEAGLISAKSPSAPSARIGFVFTGQGAQWPQMGHELLHEYAIFRQVIKYLDHVLSQLESRPTWTLEQALLEPAATSQIHDPAFSQTVCTALQIAVVALLRQWGVSPSVTVGHSSGEIAAAYAAGRLKASEAIVLAYFRGQVVITNRKEGLMMAVGLGPEDVEPYITGLEAEVKIAAVNSPGSVTLSGESPAIEILNKRFADDGLFARVLKTGGNAYHSHHMLALGPPYEQAAAKGLNDVQALTDNEPSQLKIQWVSSVTGHEEHGVPHPKYWRRNLESPVLFAPAIEKLAREAPVDLLIEIGPHPALGGPIKQIRSHLEKSGVELPPCLGSLRRGEHDVNSMLLLAGNLFTHNAPIDLAAVNATEKEASDSTISLLHGHQCLDLFQYPYSYPEEPVYFENRFNKEYRLRKHLRHDLLGARVPAGSKNHPQWRNILRMKDVPWLDDHKLLPHAVLPGAAYIAMAIEAARQLHIDEAETTGTLSRIKSFKLRQVSINSALRIEDTELGVETVLNMEKIALTNAPLLSQWYKFSIGSMVPNSDQWTEHCTGMVSTVTVDTGIDAGKVLHADAQWRSLDMKRWYQRFGGAGLGYGPAFQGLSKLQAYWDNNTAVADVALQPTEDTANESTYPMHPATLDTLIQLALISCHAGQVENLDKAFVPVFADNVTIWNPEASDAKQGKGIASGSRLGLRSLYARVQMFDESTNAPLLDIGELKCVTYDSTTDSEESRTVREPYWRPVERIDSDTLTQSAVEALFSPKRASPTTFAALETLAAHVVASVAEYVQQRNVSHKDSGNHDAFAAWVTAWTKACDRKDVIAASERRERAKVIEVLSLMLHKVPEARCLKELHDNAAAILSGETNSIKVLLESNVLAELFTSGILAKESHAQLQNYVDLLAHKNPRMRILEVGTGSASASTAVLETLSATSPFRRFDEYVITDSAAWALADAKARLTQYEDIKYQTFDITTDPSSQGFEEQSFDLIIAAGCLIEVANPAQGLQHLRTLLKPSGTLALIETTRSTLTAEFLSRTLSGKWHQNKIFASRAEWDDLLAMAGYSSSSLSLPDYADQENTSTLIVSKPLVLETAEAPKARHSDVYLVSRDRYISLLEESIASNLVKHGIKPISRDLFTSQHIPGNAAIISLVDLTGSTLASRGDLYFEAIKTLMARASCLIWVAADVHSAAESSVMKGLLRSIAAENIASKFSFVRIDNDYYTSPTRAAELLVGQLNQIHTSSTSDLAYEAESLLRAGLLYVERLLPEEELNKEFRRIHRLEDEVEQRAVGEQGPLMAKYGQPGLLSSLHFCNDEDFDKPLQADWVEIKTAAIGLNMKDLAVATARFDLDKLSTEGAGVVTRVGSAVTSLKAGDRVFGMIPGNMGNYLRSPASTISRIPPRFSFEGAASMPVVCLTSIYALQHLARLTRGESVLIQSATGGLGMALARLAKYIGADIFATVGNDQKRQVLIDDFGIPADHIFHSRSIQTIDQIMTATQQKGIDVIVSSAGGDMMHEMWRCIAPLGRFIDVGRTDVLGNGRLGLEVFKRNATFSSFDLGLVYRQKPAIIARLMTEMHDLIQMGIMKPIPHITTFDIAQLESAMSSFSKGTHTGKLVITFGNPQSTLKILRPAVRASFDPNAAYLLVGALGGLGRSLSSWMIKRGAQHLVFLSRSGLDRPEAASVVKELTEAGAKPQVLRCDVTNMKILVPALEQISKQLPIRGIIHAAMVEGDSFFDNTSLSQIQKVLAPKVTGTINLHNATRDLRLDFFLMTSSIVGTVGTPSQGAYVAANAFQDAFARYRISQSLPATALGLGLILEVGSVSDSVSFQQMLRRNATYGVSETEFLRLFEGALCESKLSSTSKLARLDPGCTAQTVTGLEASNFVSYLDDGSAEGLVWFNNPRFQNVTQAVHRQSRARNSVGNVAGGGSPLSVKLAAAATPEEKITIVREAICTRIGELLGLAADDIDIRKPIAHYGVDSLVAGELRNWMIRTFGVEISLLQLLNQATRISELVDKAAA